MICAFNGFEYEWGFGYGYSFLWIELDVCLKINNFIYAKISLRKFFCLLIFLG